MKQESENARNVCKNQDKQKINKRNYNMKKELELKEKRLKHKMKRIRYTIEENNNVMSRYDHKIGTFLEETEHLSKENIML